MRRVRRLLTQWLISLCAIALLIGCDGTQEITIEPWQALEAQLVYAWTSMDLSELEGCFETGFEHHLREEDWADYDGDGIVDEYWDLEYELLIAQQYFQEADSIHFQLAGGSSQTWSEDSTGASLLFDRTLTREIFYADSSDTLTQDVELVCRADSEGEWHFYLWFDLED